MPQQFWEVPLAGEMRLFAPPRSMELAGLGADQVGPGAVVLVDHAGHDALPHAGATQHGAPLVEQLDDVAVLDAPGGRVVGIDPDRLVHVAVVTLDLAGADLPLPGDVVVLGVGPPAGVVAHQEQRILLGPLAGEALVVAGALLDPLGIGRPLLVVGEVVGQRWE